jgi:hypothetical protein
MMGRLKSEQAQLFYLQLEEAVPEDHLVLLSQKVAGTDVENQLFEKIHDWRARG